MVLVFLTLFPAVSQSDMDFHTMVDFNVTLDALCDFVETQDSDVIESVIEQNRIFIITGSIAARQVINPDAETFLGEFDLVSGQWFGVEEVKMYKGILQFTGPRFSAMIPARRSRRANPDEVPLNSFVLVPVRLVGFRENDGITVPVLEGLSLRIIN